jgi:lysophospholipase L1-like esterase
MNLIEARYEMLKTATRRPCVVMLGDSLTAGVPWSEVTEYTGVANYGWSGDTTDGILYRLKEVILLRPRAVFLMIGANDILKNAPIADIVKNIRTIVERLEAEEIAVNVHPVLPFVDAGERVAQVNSAVAEALVDTRARLVSLPIGIEDLRDGLHLGPTGFSKWHDTIRPILKEYCA